MCPKGEAVNLCLDDGKERTPFTTHHLYVIYLHLHLPPHRTAHLVRFPHIWIWTLCFIISLSFNSLGRDSRLSFISTQTSVACFKVLIFNSLTSLQLGLRVPCSLPNPDMHTSCVDRWTKSGQGGDKMSLCTKWMVKCRKRTRKKEEEGTCEDRGEPPSCFCSFLFALGVCLCSLLGYFYT